MERTTEPVPGWPALATRGLGKDFGNRHAVESIDLDVPVGSFFGLVGPNGSGKTTTLRMASGLQRPDRGQVWIAGHDTWAEPVAVRRLLGVVPDPLHARGHELLHDGGPEVDVAPAPRFLPLDGSAG